MKCPKCGKEIEDGSKFCILCGSRIVEKPELNPKTPIKKKKKWIPLLITIALVVIIGTTGLLFSGVFNKEKTDNEKVQQGFEDYFNVKEHVAEITADYKNSKGYIEKDDINSAISTVGEYAKGMYKNKKIKDYEITEGESVWIQFNSGVEYIYIPIVEGMDSSTISTYQPCLTMYPSNLQELGSKCVDGAASKVESVLNDFSFKNNYDNDTISLDVLKSIGSNQIVIWHGHGGYNTKTHSVLLTGLKLDEEKFLLDPIYYIEKIGYTNDYLTGRILCSDSGYVMVSYKFFEKYLEDLSSSVIYLGACDSGKDDVLVNTFVDKGAKSVIGNTEEIPTEYNLKMISSVFNELVSVSDKKYQDIKTALEKAKNTNKDVFDKTGCVADVKIWGHEDTRLSDKEVQIEYKAEDLIDKSISEIIDIMGGDFEVEYGGDKLVYYTSPTVIMYNDDTLPGFAFYIDEAVADYEKGVDVKKNIKNGIYKQYAFLALLNNAKLNDNINASMKYNELTPTLGEFDCGGIAGAGNYSYYTNTVGKQTIYLFSADESLTNSYNGGDIKKDWLKVHNPKLSAIIVYPESNVDSQQSNNENENSTTVKGSEDYNVELFSKLTEVFTFSSGAGAWGTTLKINSDGSFSGNYHDSDMGDRNDSYPKGTVYYCDFSGKFGEIKKMNEYTYSMKMEKIEYNNEPNTEEIKDGFLYKYSSAYGLDEADTVLIYTPEMPISDLPEGFTSWTSRLIPPSGEILGYYGLYNVKEKEGFVSQNK